MSVENFIPTIWSAKINKALDKSLVALSLANQNYQGEITGPGDSVKITEIGPISTANYTKNSTSITYSALDDASKTLLIDQIKYASFYIDDVDRSMALSGLQEEGSRKMAMAFKDGVDSHILGLYAQAGTTANLGTTGTPITCSAGTIVSRIAQIGKELSENNVPTEGRWLVAPPWFQKNLILAIGTSSYQPNLPALENGFIGHFLGFDMFISNNVSHSSTTWYAILAGIRDAITYAGKLTNVEALRLSAQYGDGVRGLYCYGAKVIVNDALASLIVTE